MGLIDQAREDYQDITSNPNDFGVSATFTSPSGVVVDCYVLHTKHKTAFDTEQERITHQTASISVAEKILTDADYPTRDSEGNVYLENHRVDVADSSLVVKKYIISEWYPDENIGGIVLILTEYFEE